MQAMTSHAEPEEDATTEAVDLSGHNLVIRWHEVTAPIAIVKLTDGVGSPDRRAPAHCAGARDTGRTLGGYAYLRIRSGRPQDAAQQAREFAEVYTRERCEFAALDVERATNEHATPEEAYDAVTGFLAELHAILAPPTLIYTSPGEAASFRLQAMPDLAQYPLWVASYSLSPPRVPAPWQDWVLWQYTGSGQAPGVDGQCDRSRYRGTLRQFRAALGLAPALDAGHDRAGM